MLSWICSRGDTSLKFLDSTPTPNNWASVLAKILNSNSCLNPNRKSTDLFVKLNSNSCSGFRKNCDSESTPVATKNAKLRSCSGC